MNKPYSEVGMLQNQLHNNPSPNKIMKWLFQSDYAYLTMVVDYYEYLRGIVFIDDIKDSYEDVPDSFDIAVLFHLLFTDFIRQIKKGCDLKQIANYLVTSKLAYFRSTKKEKRIMKAINNHVFTFEDEEVELLEEKVDKPEKAYIKIRMKKTEILRAEVLLSDLSSYMNEHVTVEEMIAILYLDFIKEIKANGNSIKQQKTILYHLNNN